MKRFALTLSFVVALGAQCPAFAADPAPATLEKPAAAAARPASAEQRLAAVERQLEALLKEVRQLRQEAAAAAAPPQAAAADARSILVIRLRNAQAAASAEVLKEMFQWAAVDVAVDDRTNSLVVSGGPAGLADVRAAVARLDAGEKKP